MVERDEVADDDMSWSSIAYIATPEEKIVIAANERALSVRVFSSNRSLRYSGTERARDPK